MELRIMARLQAARSLAAVDAPPAPPASASSPIRLIERMGLTNRALPENLILSERPGFGRPPVEGSSDLNRILALPRRTLDIKSMASAQKWTALLRNDNTDPCDCVAKYGYCINKLWAIQGCALEEPARVSGLLGLMGVGSGKTCADIMLPMVVPNCKTALLLVPPDLRAQFKLNYAQWSRHFKTPNLAGGTWFVTGRPSLHVVAYSELSTATGTDLLERIRPDLIIADEGHNVRNRSSSRTKRFLRYFADHPDTRLCVLSGTLTSKSLKDYAHLAAFSLGEGSPLPLDWPTVVEWATALDPETGDTIAAPIGALRKLCNVGETAREGFRRRLIETPGVVATAAGAIGTSLVLRERKVTHIPPEISKALADVRATWQRPDGEELVDAITKAAVCRQLAAGVYLRWRWPRGETEEQIRRWLAARKNWHREVREKLKQSREHMDSPLLLARAAARWHDGFVHIDPETKERHEYPPGTRHSMTWAAASWPEWLEVRDTCQPETEAIWVSEYLARDAIAWGFDAPGLIWYANDSVGHRIAALGGFPFYGPGSEASEKILQEDGKRTIVVSIQGHSQGKNLQVFSRNLVVQSPSDGGVWEQLIGRSLRPGQKADEVEVCVYRHTAEMAEALDTATQRALYIQQTTGTQMALVFANRTF